MPRFKDITGKRFGKLTAICRTENRKNNTMWQCKCDCGNVVNIMLNSLTSGKTKSCGCIRKENFKKISIKKNSIKKESIFIEGTNAALISSILKNNKSKKTKSGVKGVNWEKKRNKWRARIVFKGKQIHIGYFKCLEEAIKARRKAEKELFGSFLEEKKIKF